MDNVDVDNGKMDDNLVDTSSNSESNNTAGSQQSAGSAQPYIVTETPIYSSSDAAKELGINYNMVRHWARLYAEFLPDAQNVAKGVLRLSSRDIDVIRQVLNYKETYNWSSDRIKQELRSLENSGLDQPTIFSNENFVKLMKTEGFQEFMKFYTNEMVKGVISRHSEQYEQLIEISSQQNEKYTHLLETMESLVEDFHSSPLLEADHDAVKKLEDANNEKEEIIKNLQEQLASKSKENEDLQEELYHEQHKSFFGRLFGSKDK